MFSFMTRPRYTAGSRTGGATRTRGISLLRRTFCTSYPHAALYLLELHFPLHRTCIGASTCTRKYLRIHICLTCGNISPHHLSLLPKAALGPEPSTTAIH